MKTLTLALSMVLTFGVAAFSFAGNHPALTYPSGTLVTSRDTVQMDEVTPWNKATLHYPTAVVSKGAWYNFCPAMAYRPFSKHEGIQVTLSNGKRVVVGCTKCIQVVEDNLAKYEAYLF